MQFGYPSSGRSPIRRFLFKILWPQLRQQVDFNRAIFNELEQVDRRLTKLVEQLSERVEDGLTGHHGAIVRQDHVIERFDKERAGFQELVEERIEFLQRQSLTRYHEANGSLRRDLIEVIQQFDEMTSVRARQLDVFIADCVKRLSSIEEDALSAAVELKQNQGSQLSGIRDQMIASEEYLRRAVVDQKTRLTAVEMFLASICQSLPGLPTLHEVDQIPYEIDVHLNVPENQLDLDEVSQRESYSRYITDVRKASQYGTIVDLDSRGTEWLRFMRDEHIPCYGVTTNKSKAEQAILEGLDCREGSILKTLQSIPERTLGGIFVSGLFDRLRLDETLHIVDLSIRALNNHGLLIIEGLDVDALSGSLDELFIHCRNRFPIPRLVLGYLLSARGFLEPEVITTADVGRSSNQQDPILANKKYVLFAWRR
jgi:hypothetical protein